MVAILKGVLLLLFPKLFVVCLHARCFLPQLSLSLELRRSLVLLMIADVLALPLGRLVNLQLVIFHVRSLLLNVILAPLVISKSFPRSDIKGVS